MCALAWKSSNSSLCHLVKGVPQLTPRESGQAESRIPPGKTPKPCKYLAWANAQEGTGLVRPTTHNAQRRSHGEHPGQATNPSG